MTIQLQAPFDGPVTITVLPNPDLSNTESLDDEVDYRLSMNGVPYTYVKTTGRRRLTFTFSNLGIGKLLELQEFQKAFTGFEIRLIDHRGDEWRVIFDDDEIDYSTDVRSKGLESGRRERGSVTLQLVGTEV